MSGDCEKYFPHMLSWKNISKPLNTRLASFSPFKQSKSKTATHRIHTMWHFLLSFWICHQGLDRSHDLAKYPMTHYDSLWIYDSLWLTLNTYYDSLWLTLHIWLIMTLNDSEYTSSTATFIVYIMTPVLEIIRSSYQQKQIPAGSRVFLSPTNTKLWSKVW